MPTISRIAALALALASVAALSGCDTADPEPSPSPSATAEPVFASEEEALAAATEAYAAYQATSDMITSEGGQSPERIEPYVTEEYLPVEQEGFASFRSERLSLTGQSTFDSVRLQQFDDEAVSGSFLIVYLCSDISETRVLNDAGADVTPAERPERTPLEVEYRVDGPASADLHINRSDVWSGSNFCL